MEEAVAHSLKTVKVTVYIYLWGLKQSRGFHISQICELKSQESVARDVFI